MPDPPVPSAAVTAGARAVWAYRNRGKPEPYPAQPDLMDTQTATAALDAAAPHLAATEREACAQLAESLKFSLYRPARNGPGGGQQVLDVVPLTELLDQLRKDHGTTWKANP